MMAESDAKTKEVGDFDVMKVMADRNAGLRVSSVLVGIQKGATKTTNKPGRVTMALENEHCQAIMHDRIMNDSRLSKYATLLVIIDMEEFNKIKTELEKNDREGN